MTMLSDIPDPDETVDSLLPLVPVTYGALEHGVAKAHAYFEHEGEAIEPFTFAQITRFQARLHLTRVGRLRVEFDYDELANNGLEIHYNSSPIRLRKAFRGGAPLPGSFAMENFHAQTLALFSDAEVPVRPNLILLWDVIRPAYLLAPDLYIACPKGTRLKFPNVAECHWLVKLPNVALMPQPAVRVDEIDQYDDLEIYRPFDKTSESE